MLLYLYILAVISTLPFWYPQIHEYGSFHFVARSLARHSSVTSASTAIMPFTEGTKGVQFWRSLRQVCRYFYFFSRSAVSMHFLGWVGLVKDGGGGGGVNWIGPVKRTWSCNFKAGWTANAAIKTQHTEEKVRDKIQYQKQCYCTSIF